MIICKWGWKLHFIFFSHLSISQHIKNSSQRSERTETGQIEGSKHIPIDHFNLEVTHSFSLILCYKNMITWSLVVAIENGNAVFSRISISQKNCNIKKLITSVFTLFSLWKFYFYFSKFTLNYIVCIYL